MVQEILKLSRDYTGKDVKMLYLIPVGGGRPDFWNLGALVVFSGGLDSHQAAVELTHRTNTPT